ncbi:hypothetical protein M758_UG335900 [Ceratodon purpureus]|nr:hypothetical protein M758_UG335900 [Ceratodon purpureus]
MLSAPLRVFLFVLAECVLEITDFGLGWRDERWGCVTVCW